MIIKFVSHLLHVCRIHFPFSKIVYICRHKAENLNTNINSVDIILIL